LKTLTFLSTALSLTLLSLTSHAAEPVSPSSLPLLTTARQILDLGVEGARRSPHPVKLTAVVTYPFFNRRWFYVQDGTAGVLVIQTNAAFQPVAGQQVEITGRAGPGEFAAHVFDANARVVGAGPFPQPHRTDLARLEAGAEFGHWIAVEGRVVDIFLHTQQLSLLIASGDHRFITNLRLDTPMKLPTHWLGARVEVRGVCWTITSRAGHKPVGFRIHSPGTNMIRFLEPGSTNVFNQPLHTAKSLQSTLLPPDARIRLTGTVTLFHTRSQLFLRDDTGAVRVRLLAPLFADNNLHSLNPLNVLNFSSQYFRTVNHSHLVPLQPGDRVEVVGTPLPSAFAPMLVDAEYRLLERGQPPASRPVVMNDLHTGEHDGQLVTLRARLLDRVTRRVGSIVLDLLMLESDGKPCQATLSADHTNALPALERGSFLQLTGVCLLDAGEWKTVRSTTLLLRDANDVRVVGGPPLWATWNVGRILAIAGALGVVALGWIWLLRRRVAQRTAALAASEAHTRLIIDTALDAVVTMDSDGRVCGWSAQAEKIFGWTLTEAMGRTVAELIIPEHYREAHTRGLKHLLATGQGTVVNRRIEISALRKDGAEFPVELSIVAMNSNGAWTFSAFARDLSERKQAETAIAEGEARMKTVLAHAPEAIMAFDADTGRFIEANENTLRLFGLPREEILKIGPGEVSPPVQPDGRASATVAREKVNEALAGGAPVFEWMHRHASGAGIPCEVRLARLPAAGRNLCIGTVTDISERKRVHDELLKALAQEQDLSELKTNFVNLVSHEFRTPLGIIMSATENLENYLERLQPAERTELLADIRTSTQRMSGLMQEVLLLARVDAGKLACRPVPLDLRAFVERLIEEVRGSSDHACVTEFSIASEAHAACADEALLRHMFTNLLSNAVKYSPLGQPVHFRVERDGDSAVFTVRDEGIGIPEADQKQLFQTFHRGSNVGERPGTGLGLVIVKRCVDLHGGTLHLESKLNVGTTVTVRLPVFSGVKV